MSTELQKSGRSSQVQSLHIRTAKLKNGPVEWARILSLLALYIVVLVILALPPVVLAIALPVLLYGANNEIYQAVKIKIPELHEPPYKKYAQITSLPVPILFYYDVSLIPIYLIFATIGAFCLPIITRNPGKALDKIARVLACLILATMMSFLLLIRTRNDGLALSIFLIFMVNLTDSMAYIIGKAFGKKKFLPEISPGKTWEGTIASIVITCLISIGIKYYFLTHLEITWVVLMTFVIALCAMLGDLILSTFKRDVGIKDYGMAIPGHGGILDRIDSLIIASPIFYYVLKLI